jgi:hypothetical protein
MTPVRGVRKGERGDKLGIRGGYLWVISTFGVVIEEEIRLRE